MKQFRLILAFLTIAVSLHAEDGLIIDTDSLQTSSETVTSFQYSNYIIPAACITYGALAQVTKPLRKLDECTNREVIRHFTKRRKFDDYLQYAPVTAAYGLDFMGVKAKNNFRDRTFVAITSHLIMGGSVQAVKIATRVERPDGSNRHSFPSGHTATAFVGAHILFKEYKNASLWIGVAGYAAATTVGTMRILNRKHWVSDVVAGAGFGILSVEISYMLLPTFHKIIGIEQSQPNLVIMPVVGHNQYGLGMAYVF